MVIIDEKTLSEIETSAYSSLRIPSMEYRGHIDQANQIIELVIELRSALQREAVAVNMLKEIGCDHWFHEVRDCLAEIERMKGLK